MTSSATNGIVEAAVGFGSNVGDCIANLREALRRILAIDGVRLVCASSVYETDPVGVPEKYRDIKFLNAAAFFDVRGMALDEWSRNLHAIEDAMLRVRTGERNSPRVIDIDLLTFGDMEVSRPGIRIPHPQCTSRRFVCAPLAEMRPGFVIPGDGRTVAEILRELPETPGVRRMCDFMERKNEQ